MALCACWLRPSDHRPKVKRFDQTKPIKRRSVAFFVCFLEWCPCCAMCAWGESRPPGNRENEPRKYFPPQHLFNQRLVVYKWKKMMFQGNSVFLIIGHWTLGNLLWKEERKIYLMYVICMIYLIYVFCCLWDTPSRQTDFAEILTRLWRRLVKNWPTNNSWGVCLLSFEPHHQNRRLHHNAKCIKPAEQNWAHTTSCSVCNYIECSYYAKQYKSSQCAIWTLHFPLSGEKWKTDV